MPSEEIYQNGHFLSRQKDGASVAGSGEQTDTSDTLVFSEIPLGQQPGPGCPDAFITESGRHTPVHSDDSVAADWMLEIEGVTQGAMHGLSTVELDAAPSREASAVCADDARHGEPRTDADIAVGLHAGTEWSGYDLWVPESGSVAAGFAFDRTYDYEVRADTLPRAAVIDSQVEMTHSTMYAVASAVGGDDLLDLILDDTDGAERVLAIAPDAGRPAICAFPDVCFTLLSGGADSTRLYSGEWVPPAGVGDLMAGLSSDDLASDLGPAQAELISAQAITDDVDTWQW